MTIILKIGGSVLTDKNKVSAARPDAIARIAREVGEFSREVGEFSREVGEFGGKGLILVHGAGSFGHHQAKEYRLKDGLNDESIKGILPTHNAVKSLNGMILDALEMSGVDALPVHPLSNCTLNNGRIEHMCMDVIERMLRSEIVPVLHGDVAMDRARGVDILSGDQIVTYLAEELHADRVGIGTNVDGVLDSDGKVIKKITPSNYNEINGLLSGSGGVDVTGGMQGKIAELIALARAGIPSRVFNVEKAGNIAKFLKNDLTDGTLIGGE